MDKAAKGFINDNMFSMSAYWVCSGTIIAGLTQLFNIPVSISSVITGLTATMPLLQIAGGYAYSSVRNRHRFLIFANGMWRILLPLAFFAVLLPQKVGGIIMVVAVVLEIGIFQFAAPSQNDWMVGCVQGKVKSDYYSIREAKFMALFTVMFCAASLLIDQFTKNGNVKGGYLSVGIMLTIPIVSSLIVLLKLPAPDSGEDCMQKKPKFTQLFKKPLQNKLFVSVMVANMVWSFGNMFNGNFAQMYQIRVLGLDFFYIMIFATIGNVARVIFTPLMARIAAKKSWKFATCISLAMMAVTALGYMFITKENYEILFPILSITSAIPNAGIGVGFFQMLVASVPDNNRSPYFSVNATLNGASAFVGSLACGAIVAAIQQSSPAATDENLRFIFVIGLIMTLASVFAVNKLKSRAK